MPIGNVFRTLLLGMNLMDAGCRDGMPEPVASLNGFGGPLLYLFIQVIALLLLLIWLEGGMPRMFSARAPPQRGEEAFELNTMHPSAGGQKKDGVTVETTRAEKATEDLVQALHVSKSFGSNRAVDDLTFGLARGHVMALIGPNGAGKSTLVNMLQGELSPDTGKILLCQEDSRSPGAKKNLGGETRPNNARQSNRLLTLGSLSTIRRPRLYEHERPSLLLRSHQGYQ